LKIYKETNLETGRKLFKNHIKRIYNSFRPCPYIYHSGCTENIPVKQVPAGNENESLSIQSVASEMLAVAKEEYNKALFDIAYSTLLKAKKYEKFLTAAEQSELNKYLLLSKEASAKRIEAIEHIRAAKKRSRPSALSRRRHTLKRSSRALI